MTDYKLATKKELEEIRAKYPIGSRIELIYMDDPYTKLRPGTKGTVTNVDPLGDLEVDWDNGSRLKVILWIDRIRRL